MPQQAESNLMDEFLLLVRRRCETQGAEPPAQMQQQLWQDWISQLEAADILLAPTAHLDETGWILEKGRPVAEGLYVEGEEAISGLVIIRALDYESAMRIAQGCPVLAAGGSVEVRQAL